MARSIRDCAVCVVGGAGFLGSHLVDHLIDDRNCDVLVVDNLCVGRREFVHEKAAFVHHDITGSEEFLRHLFETHNVRYVFNAAAWPYVPNSYDRPMHVFNVNAMGALKVINAAQESGCDGILQMSSAEIYQNQDLLACGLSETSRVAPTSTYGCGKLAIDALCQVSWRERQTPVIALRQFNAVGSRDILHPYVIPDIYRQLVPQNREIPATIQLGNNSERDFIDAQDAMAIAVELLEYGAFGEIYNSGSGESYRIYVIANMIAELMGFPSLVVNEDESRRRVWELWQLRADNGKLLQTIRYRPKRSFAQSLANTIKWYEESEFEWPW